RSDMKIFSYELDRRVRFQCRKSFYLILRSRVSGVSKGEADIEATSFSWRCEASSSDGLLFLVPFANGLGDDQPARASAPPHHEDSKVVMPRRGSSPARAQRGGRCGRFRP